MRLVFRPLNGEWPGERTPSNAQQATRFRVGWTRTLEDLEREVWHLAGDAEVVLQVDAPERAMRLDGGIRADARVNSPGVILSFETRRHGPLRYACDTYMGSGWGSYLPGWQANVRAIGLTLEALRAVDRYGAASRGEQYRGWSALPPAREAGATAMTREDAARFIAGLDDHLNGPEDWPHLLHSDDILAASYRRASKRCHPDQGGDPAIFRRLTEARDVLLGRA